MGSSALVLGYGIQIAASDSPFIYTEADRYDAKATLSGAERFPAGAKLRWVSAGRERDLVGEFAASADACVSFDGQRVLFSGKRTAGDPWQIWETPVTGGAARRVTASRKDAITPFYLPADKIVYSQRTAHGYRLEVLPLEGGTPTQLTFVPGNQIATDVLRDGRILFEAPHPAGTSGVRDIYTVYPDGSGVETYRCDHGRDRHAGRQVASGDIVFAAGGTLARFTSARATAVDAAVPPGEFEGPVAEPAPGELMAPHRPGAGQAFAVYRWKAGSAPVRMTAPTKANALQPVIVRPHTAPKWFPSGLGNREGANLLCLNAYTSRLGIAPGAARNVRVWTLNDEGAAVALGEAPVEADGSFYVQVPSERPIRFQLLNAAGATVAQEKGWFWTRQGEQRVCVGCHAGPERAPDNVSPAVLHRTTDPVKMLMPVHTSAGGGK